MGGFSVACPSTPKASLCKKWSRALVSLSLPHVTRRPNVFFRRPAPGWKKIAPPVEEDHLISAPVPFFSRQRKEDMIRGWHCWKCICSNPLQD
ncbi:hypothetical protein TNIN_329961 [Trichonephila inaurata madagascariensis]|uniref:Uncharacterized protein n=1 Tax=Trichonephila inaurata madagascariensis TaxID=2747483 RepID=A0A8X6WNH9_9ARAC|nr:hypothetical protein TNIN_329961 [Trichonephila inaurata madagascariensis]